MNTTKTTIMIALLAIISTTATHAQTGGPSATCQLDPYPDARGRVGVKCLSFSDPNATEGQPVRPTVYTFGEGVVHAPGSELAWIILTNFGAAPQVVTIELIVQGQGSPTWRQFTVAPFERFPYAIHDDEDFGGMHTFTARVYWGGDGDASLVMRPASDPFSRVTLPPPTVSTPHVQ